MSQPKSLSLVSATVASGSAANFRRILSVLGRDFETAGEDYQFVNTGLSAEIECNWPHDKQFAIPFSSRPHYKLE